MKRNFFDIKYMEDTMESVSNGLWTYYFVKRKQLTLIRSYLDKFFKTMNKTENIKINKINSVYDGDTFRGQVNAYPKWFGEDVGFRIYGIDTPEKSWRAKSANEALLGEVARNFTYKLITDAKHVEFDVIKWDKYGGRIDATVRADGVDVAQALLEKGLAKEYDGGKKPSWEDIEFKVVQMRSNKEEDMTERVYKKYPNCTIVLTGNVCWGETANHKYYQNFQIYLP
jgi:endonuclease YncB( thermonuclease family)